MLFEFYMNARTPIDTPIVVIRIFNTLRKLFIIPFSLACASFAPIIVPIFRDFEHTAHADNRKTVTMSVNKRKFYGWGCAKMLIAFFRISLSCLSISFSRLSLLFSSSIAV